MKRKNLPMEDALYENLSINKNGVRTILEKYQAFPTKEELPEADFLDTKVNPHIEMTDGSGVFIIDESIIPNENDKKDFLLNALYSVRGFDRENPSNKELAKWALNLEERTKDDEIISAIKENDFERGLKSLEVLIPGITDKFHRFENTRFPVLILKHSIEYAIPIHDLYRETHMGEKCPEWRSEMKFYPIDMKKRIYHNSQCQELCRDPKTGVNTFNLLFIELDVTGHSNDEYPIYPYDQLRILVACDETKYKEHGIDALSQAKTAIQLLLRHCVLNEETIEIRFRVIDKLNKNYIDDEKYDVLFLTKEGGRFREIKECPEFPVLKGVITLAFRFAEPIPSMYDWILKRYGIKD